MKNQRLLSLDILRGIAIAGMILVNNGWGRSYEMLLHCRWNGMTPCDLVFPFLLFVMGVSCYLSLSKSEFKPTAKVVYHVARRTVLLFAIGLFIHWFANALMGEYGFAHLRISGVLQRIALSYCAVSLFALFCNHRYTLHVVVLLLVIYSAVLVFGNGYAMNPNVNILAKADLQLFGYDHLYHGSVVDPEGLLGTIPSIAHVMLGFCCGRLISQKRPLSDKVIVLFVFGTVLTIGGWLLSYGLPLNKHIWSPSYVMVTCGLAALLQALLMWIVDRSAAQKDAEAKNVQCSWQWYTFFRIFGVNALALYVTSELLAIMLGEAGVLETVYGWIHAVIFSPKPASLIYALYFVLINFAIGYVLYHKKIYLKL